MKRASLALLAAVATTPFCARAIEVAPSASLSIFRTDNAFASHLNPQAEVGVDAFAGISVQHHGPRVDVNTDVGVVRREFGQGSTDAETLPQGRASIFLSLVPEKLSWEFDDRMGRTTSRSFTALAESDRDNVNLFRTGPDLRLSLPAHNAILVSTRASQSTFQNSDIDSRRYSGSFAGAHYFTELSFFGFTYSRELVNYTGNDLYPSSRSESAHVNFSLDSQRTFFATELGVESLEVGNQGSRKTPRVLVSLRRRTSPRWTVSAEYRHEFSDVADSLRADLIDRFSSGTDQGARVVAEPYKGDVAYIMAVRSAGKLLMAWQVGLSRENYARAFDQFDRKNYSGQMQAYYTLNSYWGINGRLRWIDDNSFQSSARVKYATAGIGITRQASRSLALSLDAEHSRSDSRDLLRRFSENRVTFSLSYSPPGRTRRIFSAPTEMRIYEGVGMPRPVSNVPQQNR